MPTIGSFAWTFVDSDSSMHVLLFPCIVCDANMNVHMNSSSDDSYFCFANVPLSSSQCGLCPPTCQMTSSSSSSSNDNIDDNNDHYFCKTSCKLGDACHGAQGCAKCKDYETLLNVQTSTSSSFNNIEIMFYVLLMSYCIMLSSAEEEDKNDYKDYCTFMIQHFRSCTQQSCDKFKSSKDIDRAFASCRIIEHSSS